MATWLLLLTLASCPVDSIRVVPESMPHWVNYTLPIGAVDGPDGQCAGVFVSPNGDVVALIPNVDPETVPTEFENGVDPYSPRGWWLAVEGYEAQFYADEDLLRFSDDYSVVISRRGADLIIRRLFPPTIEQQADSDTDGDIDMIDFARLQRGETDLDGFAGVSRMDCELFALVAGGNG